MRTCPDCGVPEQRTTDERGRPVVNLDPFTGKCVACLTKAAATSHTFHSRRQDRLGKTIDTKSLSAGRDE